MENLLKNKKIILGITGSIAAYKSTLIIRELKKLGADVHVIATPHALEFITPVTLANLSRNKVISEMFDSDTQSGGAWHIELAHECDLMIIAPCSATTLGKIANGICDNSLVTLTIAKPVEIPLLISPAMDTSMWLHPSTQRNIEQLKKDGAIIIPPGEGELSSGLVGPGRLPEIEVIIEYTKEVFSGNISKSGLTKDEKEEITNEFLNKPLESIEESIVKDEFNANLELQKLKLKSKLSNTPLKGKNILITAGPTHEKIDDVRYIANKSSGKMGFALAEKALMFGANVILITGPVELTGAPGINRVDIETAEEMYEEVNSYIETCDIAIFAAAVADYKPKTVVSGKIKKEAQGSGWNIELSNTKDILKEIGNRNYQNKLIVGFALESENEIENGWKKLKSKNANMIVVNSALQKNAGMGQNYNAITILNDREEEINFETMSKEKCAEAILNEISNYMK